MNADRRQRIRRRLRRVIRLGLAAATLVAAVCGLLWMAFPFDKAPLYRIPTGVTWTDRDGVPLRVRLAADGLDSVPGYVFRDEDWIAKAVVAAEDRRFWSHRGVDALAVTRSCKQTVVAMRRVSGASTLSMQLIRLSDPRPRSLPNKIVEAFRALQMERQLGKREILALYLNRAPFGANVVGIEAASRRYFAKGPHDLTLGEAALLAGLPQSPTRFNPVRHPAAAKKRQGYVLERMAACGMITDEQLNNALAQPLRVQPNRYPFLAPHFCDTLVRQPADGATEIRTTLDLDLQRTVEESVAKYAPALRADGIRGAAVVVLDARTGGIRALVGSPDYHSPVRGAQVNAALAPRSAGSTLKPFVYALALDRGLVTPLRTLYDVPESYRDYDPANFDQTYQGVVTLRDALVHSLNLPAIKVEKDLGQPRFHAALRDLGLRTLSKPPEHYGLGLVLGNGEVTLLDLTNAYACLARGGMYRPWRTTPSPAPEGRRVFSEEACWMISDIMGGDERAMDSTGTVADIRIPRLAWKTGTSSGFRDAWTIAYNPEYVIGVWLGNPDGRASAALVGRKAAAPVVWDICRRLYPSGTGPWFAKPEAIESREVCALTGQAPCPNCQRVVRDHAISGVSRFETCEVHRFGREAVWPARVAEFLRVRGNAGSGGDTGELVITTPANDSAYLHLRDANPRGSQSIPLSAASNDPSAALHWFVNDSYVGESRSGGTLFWQLRAGTHRVVCSDSRGTSRSVRIVVNEPRGGMAGSRN